MKSEKRCPKCDIVKPASEYYHVKHRNGTRHLSNYCKVCARAQAKIPEVAAAMRARRERWCGRTT